jgi:hypothetical protein
MTVHVLPSTITSSAGEFSPERRRNICSTSIGFATSDDSPFGNVDFKDVLGVADIIGSVQGSTTGQGNSLFDFLDKPADRTAFGGSMVHVVTPSAVGVVIVPFNI